MHAGSAGLSLFGNVVSVLREAGISHAVIGATALAFHGVARSTRDLDLFAMAAVCLEPDTWRSLEASGSTVEIRPGDAADPLAGVVRFESGREAPVDLVLGNRAWQAEILTRTELQTLLGIRVPVVRAADLVLLKLYAGGLQDRWDIEQLLSAEDPSELVTEVEHSLTGLPSDCAAIWRQIRSEKQSR